MTFARRKKAQVVEMRRQNAGSKATGHAQEYSENTTLHGVKYVGEKDVSIVRR